jgi:two-component system NtrC family sensor kinase
VPTTGQPSRSDQRRLSETFTPPGALLQVPAEELPQLLERWRLAAVGQLAAGVAHEINNPLFAILGTIEFMLEEAPPGSELRDRLERIQRSGEEIREIVRALVEFAREPAVDRHRLWLADVCAQTVQLVRRSSLAKGIEVVERYPEEPIVVDASANQLKQILLALIRNAQQAQPADGQVEVELLREATHAVVRVRDHGPGIDEAVFPHIFEPFFTTRLGAGASGLGLTVALGLAQLQGGELKAESELGGGSTFTLRLPVVP